MAPLSLHRKLAHTHDPPELCLNRALTMVNSASMSSPCTSQQAQPLGSSRISVVSFLAIMTRSLSMEISPNCSHQGVSASQVQGQGCVCLLRLQLAAFKRGRPRACAEVHSRVDF